MTKHTALRAYCFIPSAALISPARELGASSVMQEYVQIVNRFGGEMPNAIGIPEEMLREAAKMAVCKINIDSDLRLAMTAAVRRHLAEHPDHFDPRQYLTDARTAIREVVAHKLIHVLGCAGKA